MRHYFRKQPPAPVCPQCGERMTWADTSDRETYPHCGACHRGAPIALTPARTLNDADPHAHLVEGRPR